MSVNSILNTFYEKESQKNSLKLALKDLIQKQPQLNKDLLVMFKELIPKLENDYVFEDYSVRNNKNEREINLNMNLNLK